MARDALGLVLAAGTHDAVARLHWIKAPTLVVHGDGDLLVPLRNAEQLAARIPGAELLVLSNTSHFFLFERRGADACHR